MPYEFNPFTEEFDFYLYEPTEYVAKAVGDYGSWDDSAVADLPVADSVMPALRIGDTIYIIGGYQWYTAVRTYDITSDTYSNYVDLPEQVYFNPGLTDGEKLWSIGGDAPGSATTKSVYVLDTTDPSPSWTKKADAPVGDYGCVAAYDLDNDIIYFLRRDGSSIDKYTVSSNTWTTGVISLPSGLSTQDRPSFFWKDGYLWMIGGQDGSSYIADTYKYSLSAGTWTHLTSRPYSAQTPYEYCYCDEYYLCAGGYNGSNRSECCKYTFATDTWETLDSLPSARMQNPLVMLENKSVISFGGYTSGSIKQTLSLSRSIECYPVVEEC